MSIELESGVPAITRPTFLLNSVFDLPGTITNTGGGNGLQALNGVTYDAWQLTATTGNLDIVLDAPATVDTLCVAAHNLGTVGSTVFVQYQDVDLSYVNFAGHVATNDSPIMLCFPPQTRGNFRVRFGATPSGNPRAGVIMLGTRTTLPSGIVGDYVPTNWGRRVEIMGGETLSGQFLGQRIIRQSGETRITPGLIDRTWWNSNGDALRTRYDEGKPFFYAGGPSLFPHDLAYCWRPERAQELRPAYTQSNFVTFGMDVNFYA